MAHAHVGFRACIDVRTGQQNLRFLCFSRSTQPGKVGMHRDVNNGKRPYVYLRQFSEVVGTCKTLTEPCEPCEPAALHRA